MPEVLMSPEKMTECMVGTRKRLGYDGLCAGAYGGIAASGRIAEVRRRNMSCIRMTRTSQQECGGILDI